MLKIFEKFSFPSIEKRWTKEKETVAMRYNVDAWQIIRVPNRYLSQGLIKILEREA